MGGGGREEMYACRRLCVTFRSPALFSSNKLAFPNKLARGRAQTRPGWREKKDHLRHAGLWAAALRPSFRTRIKRPWSRSRPPHPGRDGASQRNPVGHGGSVAFGRAASRGRNDRPARSQDQPKAAARRRRLRPAALAAAAGADTGSKCRGNALARRHGGSRARPLRALRPPTMASAT